MSREIKFRAWDGGKMIYEKDISHILLEDGDILRLARFFCNVRNDCKVMQYTGRKDKNGVEIYEGDIVSVDTEEETEALTLRDSYLLGVVEFEHGAFLIALQTDNGKMFASIDHETLVMGNIYEHANLLEP